MRPLPAGMREKVLAAAELFADVRPRRHEDGGHRGRHRRPQGDALLLLRGQGGHPRLPVQRDPRRGGRGPSTSARADRGHRRRPAACASIVAHLRVFEELPRGQPGPAVRPRPGRPHPPHRRADRGRLPRPRAAAARGGRRGRQPPAVEHPRVWSPSPSSARSPRSASTPSPSGRAAAGRRGRRRRASTSCSDGVSA